MSRTGPAWRAAFAAEISKSISLPWTRSLVAVATLATFLPALFADLRVSTSDTESLSRLSDTFGLALCVVVLSVLGCVVSGSDLRSGELNVELTSVPFRPRLVVAKLSSLWWLTAGVSIGAFVIDRVVRYWTSSAPDAGVLQVWQVGVGFAVSSVTLATVGFALTAILHNTMIAIALLMLTPVLIVPLLERVAPAVSAGLPFSASSIAVTGTGSFPMSWQAGVAILAGWWLMASIVFTIVVHRHDG